jgi:uncharacterized membrane-anchored protein
MSRRVRIGFIVVVAAQVLALAGMVAQRVYLLRTGTPVMLECVPIDPRSLFSGDYVRLNYRISRFSAEDLKRLNPRDERFRLNDTVYVALERVRDSRFYEARAISHDREWLRQRWPVVIRGTTREGSSWDGLHVRYGVEEYFVPQHQGRRIEGEMAHTSVEVAVSPTGESGIRRLFIDDQEVVFR